MTLSKFAWGLYCESKEGKAAIRRSIAEFAGQYVAELGDAPFDEECLIAVPDENGDFQLDGQTVVDLHGFLGNHCDFAPISSPDDADALFESILDDGLEWSAKDTDGQYSILYGGAESVDGVEEQVITSITGLTSGLHQATPEFFFPYLFARRFDKLTRICSRYEIDLPELPGKLQKRERALYYFAVNRRFQEFRKSMGMSPSELNAFLYDFAPKDLDAQDLAPLPAPTRTWFVMGGIGGNGDFEFLDNADSSSVSYWQGNLETRRGDAIIMWCVAPRSAVHSVWRSTDDGFIDPYFYFYSMIRVGNPIRVPAIKFAELKKHPEFGKHPAVRAHFQGRNGMAFTVDEYKMLVEMLGGKGMDVSLLPPPPAEMQLPDASLYDIGSAKERKEAFIQAKSYAMRLNASVLVLAARQGIWLYQLTSRGFDEDQHVYKTWIELASPDKLAEIARWIGKRKIDASVAERERRKRRPAT